MTHALIANLPRIGLAVALAVLAPLAAHAAAVTKTFDIEITSGELLGLHFGGQFSYDDTSADAGPFGTTYALTDFSFAFEGTTYTIADVAPDLLLWSEPTDGDAGLEGVFGSFSFLPGDGFFGPTMTYVFADPGRLPGGGDVSYADAPSAVPEPGSAALALAALLGLGAARRARRGA
ncbi:MAG TPA: PEP-CTERM sorting domain-containing protein [Aquabacterium sp.]|nr:PEP-CTERM sorting domain-containing protein [Aquabacterium sp.]